jgi:hypothetical protein
MVCMKVSSALLRSTAREDSTFRQPNGIYPTVAAYGCSG